MATKEAFVCPATAEVPGTGTPIKLKVLRKKLKKQKVKTVTVEGLGGTSIPVPLSDVFDIENGQGSHERGVIIQFSIPAMKDDPEELSITITIDGGDDVVATFP